MISTRSNSRIMRNLRFAIKKRNAEEVYTILRMRPKLRTPEGGQMLWGVMDNPEIAAMLVRAGVDLNERNPTDNSSFLLCVTSRADNEKYLHLALLMMTYGANVNFRTNTGNTALHLAVRVESMILVGALVESGLSVDITNANQETAICLAAQSSRADEMLSLLIEQQPFDAAKRNARILDAIEFLICLETDESCAIRKLLELGVNVNERSDCGLTPLALAVSRGKTNLLKMLIEFGSDMDEFLTNTNLPLIKASYMEQTLLMELLPDKQGMKVNVCDENGKSPLHMVCASSKFMPLRNLQLLLNLGANVNAFDNSGNTPFSLIDVKLLNDFTQLYIKHLAVLFWKGSLLNNIDIKIIRSDFRMDKFYEDCLAELYRMMETVVYNDFSMFDFFIKGIEKSSMLAKNANFVASYNNKRVLFPLYLSDLDNMFQMCVKRRDVLRSMEDIIHSAADQVLPLSAVEKIAYYESLDKLKIFKREFYFELHAQTSITIGHNNEIVID